MVECPYTNDKFLNFLEVVINLCTLGIFSLCGLVGNVAAIIILSTRFLNTYTILLIVLLMFHIFSHVPSLHIWAQAVGNYIGYISYNRSVAVAMYPFSYFITTGRIYVVVVITLELYRFTINGSRAELCQTNWTKVLIYIIPSLLLAIIHCLAHAFDYEINEESDILSKPSDIMETSFPLVRSVFDLIIRSIAPYTILIFLHRKIAQTQDTKIRPRIYKTQHGVVYARPQADALTVDTEALQMASSNPNIRVAVPSGTDHQLGMSKEDMSALTIGNLWVFYIYSFPTTLALFLQIIRYSVGCTSTIYWFIRLLVRITNFFDALFAVSGFWICYTLSSTFKDIASCSSKNEMIGHEAVADSHNVDSHHM